MQATKKGSLLPRTLIRSDKVTLLSIPLSILGLLVLFVISPYVNETMPEKQTAALVLLAIGYILWFAVAYPSAAPEERKAGAQARKVERR